MAYVVGNPRTGQQLTACLDHERARQLTCGFEQHVVRPDIGARNHYWHLGRLGLGLAHPYDAAARAALEAERDEWVTRAHRVAR